MDGYGISSTGPGADARRASSVNVPAGPRNATRRGTGLIPSPNGVRLGAGRERGLDRLLLRGRQLDLRLALVDLLDVHAGLVAVHDRGEDDPGAVLVEHRVGARLGPGHLAVG